MSRKLKLIVAIGCCLISIGYYLPLVAPALANTSPPNTRPSQPTIITLVGTIQKVAVEGGCYQLVASDGKNYELTGKFPKRNGIKVRVRGEVVRDTATICQVGQLIRVKSFKVIRKSPRTIGK
jgi:hypothetical protein